MYYQEISMEQYVIGLMHLRLYLLTVTLLADVFNASDETQ